MAKTTLPRLNKEWHLRNKMPKNPTLQERTRWHVAHSQNCGCRPLPDSIRAIIDAAGNSPGRQRTAAP